MNIITKVLLKIKKIAYLNKWSSPVFCIKKLTSLFFLTIIPFISACDYLNKCIEADDFGESQIEFLEIKSNNLEDKCKFDNKFLSDPLSEDAKLNGEFGEEMKRCLFLDKGSVSYDSNTYYFTAGCASIDKTISGITDDQKASQIRVVCVSSCRAKCIQGNSGSAVTSEPDWKYTSSSLTVSPETQIKITAVGSVNLRSSITEGVKFSFLPERSFPNISTPLYRKPGEPLSLLLKGGYKVAKIGDVNTYYYGTDQDKGNVNGEDCLLSANCYIKPASSLARRVLIYARSDKSKINIKNKEEWRNDLLPSLDYLYEYGGKLASSLKNTDPVYESVCDSSTNSCKLIINSSATSLKLEIKSKSGNNLSNIIYNKITKDQNGSSYYVQKTITTLGGSFKSIDIVNSEDSIVITNSNDIEFKATSLSFKVHGATKVEKSGFLYFSYLNSAVAKIKIPLTIAFSSSTVANEDYKDNNFEVSGSGDKDKYLIEKVRHLFLIILYY
ncbi:MAG: hypothetical protein LW595_05635 [Rickettsiales bacterium]|nr:hypothetical protein [Rickettsiales bacterium]